MEILPRLFATCLKNAVLDKVNRENHGIDFDGEHLAHLDFADDVIMMAHTPQGLEKMLSDIHTTSKPVGLSLHLEKTKVPFSKHDAPANIVVDGTAIEQVEGYISLGRTIRQDLNLLSEVKGRIQLKWAAFGKVDNIARSGNGSMKVKRKIFNIYVLPVMTYGSETWALNKVMEEMTAAARRKMERIILRISLRDQKRNTWIRYIQRQQTWSLPPNGTNTDGQYM